MVVTVTTTANFSLKDILLKYQRNFKYLPISIAKGIGVPSSKGSLLVGFLAVCQTIGKIGFGRLADYPGLNRLSVFQCGLLVSAVANSLLPLAKSFEALVVYSIIQGVCDGCFGVLIGLVTHDIVGKRLMADALGCLYLVVAIPMTLGPPVAGMFYDHLGNYDAIFFLASALVCTGTCLMFLVPWLIPKSLPEKDELILDDEKFETSFYDNDDEHYDMSYVDEQKLADLFGRKKARNLLLERASLRNSCASTRASSFVLFSIVSEDQHRDISAYTSRQELSIMSGANTPLRDTPATRRRVHDCDSRVSMHSLRQSCTSLAHSELHIVQESVDPENSVSPLIYKETALETVREEVNELERKLSQEERKLTQDKVQSVEIDVSPKETFEHDDRTIQENDCFPGEETYIEKDISIQETGILSLESKRLSWVSDSKNSLKSSGTQLSEGTLDSGYDDTTWRGSSDVDSHHSVDSLMDSSAKLPTDIIYRSYSCINVSSIPKSEFPHLTSTSDDYIDYIEDIGDLSIPKCIPNYEKHSISSINTENVVERGTNRMLSKVDELIKTESLSDFPKLDFTEDLYSLEVDKAFELEDVDKNISKMYDRSSFHLNLKESIRETVV